MRWALLIFIGLCIFVVVYFLNTGLGKCYTIGYSNFIKKPNNVFISPKMPKSLHHILEYMVVQARKRNADFWGEVTDTPTIIFCANIEEYNHYGIMPQALAMVYMSPFGAFIVVKPDGANLDVIAHEYCHAELQKRIGWWKKQRQIPAWFDEGLALQLDYRYPNNEQDVSYQAYKKKWDTVTENGKFAPKISELTEVSNFFSGKYLVTTAYLTSGLYVAKWLEKEGKEGLKKFIQEIKAGKDFSELGIMDKELK